ASRSRDAFSGSSPRRASESRNIRSSSSVICAATFSWVKPILSRSVTVSPFGLSAAFASGVFSSSKTPAALSAFFSWAAAGRGAARARATAAAARRAGTRGHQGRACGLGLLIEHLLRARLPGLLGGVEDILLHLDDFGHLVHDVDEAFPLRHLLQ